MAPSSWRVACCADRALSIRGIRAADGADPPPALHSYSLARGQAPGGGVLGLPQTAGISGLSWCADGTCLAAVAQDSSKLILTYCKGGAFTSTEITSSLPCPLVSVCFPRSTIKRVLLASVDKKVVLYDIARRKPSKEFNSKHPVTCLSCNANDSLVASGCVGGAIGVFSLVTNNASAPMTLPGTGNGSGGGGGCGDDVSCVRFSPARRHLLCSADDGGRMALWDCNASAVVRCFSEHAAPSTGATFSPLNDTLMLSCGLDKRCVCYDADAGKRVSDFKSDSPLTCVEALPDGRSVVLGTSAGKVHLYDLRSYVRPVCTFDGPRPGTPVKAILCQPADPASAAASGTSSLLLKGSRSKSKLLPRAQSSTSNLMKENVPAPALSPVVATRLNQDSPRAPSPQSAGNNRDSFSSQIFSPLKEGSSSSSRNPPGPASLTRQSSGGVLGSSFVNNQSLGVGSNTAGGHTSVDSVFSPLREQSVNSPLAGAGASSIVGNRSNNSFLRSPVDSFNRSITTPLVSPLVPICEEEMLATPEDEDAPDIVGEDFAATAAAPGTPPGRPPRISKVEFSARASKAGPTAGAGGDSPVSFKEPFSQPSCFEAPLQKQRYLSVDRLAPLGGTTEALVDTFKESRVVASTPSQHPNKDSEKVLTAFPALDEKREEGESTAVDNVYAGSETEEAERRRSRHEEAVGEIKAVLTAFPKAFLEAKAADSVDTRVLNSEQHSSSSQETVAGGGNNLSTFQRQYLSSCVEDAMEEHCHEMRMFMYKVEYDMVRGFQLQREELQHLLREYAVNEGLVAEVQRLRRENQELRKYF